MKKSVLQFKILRRFIYILTFYILLAPGKTWAIFSLDKILLQLDDVHKSNSITIYNIGNQTTSYKISLEHYKILKDQRYKLITKPEGFNFADKFILYTPLKVTIEANSYQTIRIQRRSMVSASDGEYISYLAIKEEPVKYKRKKTNSFGITLIPVYKATLPIILTKGKLSSTYYIKDIKVNKNPNNNIGLSTTLAINGNKTIIGSLRVLYKNKVLAIRNNVKLFSYTKETTVNILIDRSILEPYRNLSLIHI